MMMILKIWATGTLLLFPSCYWSTLLVCHLPRLDISEEVCASEETAARPHMANHSSGGYEYFLRFDNCILLQIDGSCLVSPL